MTKQLITLTDVKNLRQNTLLHVHNILKGLWDPLEYSLEDESTANLLNIVITYLEGRPHKPFSVTHIDLWNESRICYGRQFSFFSSVHPFGGVDVAEYS